MKSGLESIKDESAPEGYLKFGAEFMKTLEKEWPEAAKMIAEAMAAVAENKKE